MTLLFAFSTQLAWSYYGAKSTAYLFNESTPRAVRLSRPSAASVLSGGVSRSVSPGELVSCYNRVRHKTG